MIYRGGNKPFTAEEFIEQAKLIHGDKYDYSLVEYKNARTKVKIKCPIHGWFEQTPENHKKCGCKKCSKDSAAKKQMITKEKFLEKMECYKNKLDFSNIDYISFNKPIKNIKCKKHNIVFNVSSGQALRKGGNCPECLNELPNHKKTNEEYIKELTELHLDKIYDFSKINYVNAKTPIIMICKKCNKEFSHNPRGFLKGVVRACPNCHYFLGEKIIEEVLKENKVEFLTQYKFTKTEISRLSFDFYIPKLNIVIEFQGEQHYKPIKKWGGKTRLEKQQINDQKKRNFCKKNNIKEIEINKNNIKDLFTIFEQNGIIKSKEQK